MIDIDRAKQNPSKYFDRPSDVVTAPGLERQQRIDILRQWEYDARQLEVATEENMGADGNGSDRLHEIHEALQAIGSDADTNPAGSKLG